MEVNDRRSLRGSYEEDRGKRNDNDPQESLPVKERYTKPGRMMFRTEGMLSIVSTLPWFVRTDGRCVGNDVTCKKFCLPNNKDL